MKPIYAIVAVVVLAGGGAAGALVQMGGRVDEGARDVSKVRALDLSAFSQDPPSTALDLVFLHHSVGQHMLAEVGPEGGDPITGPQPNGGGLRKLLVQNNYRVHEATYGSKLGEHTDMFDWLPKFRDRMDDVLRIDVQDAQLPDGKRNQIVMFKSCYPQNMFVARGQAPGSPNGPELTVENARATMRELRKEFEKRPDVLFVYLTAPPLSPQSWPEPLWKWGLKKAMGKPTAGEKLGEAGRLAREFNDWMKAEDGWLAGYPHKNVVVFDFYDVLTDGVSDLSRYPTGADGSDNHPSSAGNSKAAKLLVPFLNRAVRRMGLGAPSAVQGAQAVQEAPAAGATDG